MPSFTANLFSRKNPSSSSIENVDNKYESLFDTDSSTTDLLPTYTPKPAPRRIVLPREDPMQTFARLNAGHHRGGVKFVKKAKTNA